MSACRSLKTLVVALTAFAWVGCGSGNISMPPPSSITVTIAPLSTNVQAGIGTQQFSATVQGDLQNQGVTWSLSGTGCNGSGCGTLGSLTANPVTYASPASVPGSTVKLTATANADSTKSDSATITVTAPITVSVQPINPTLQLNQQQQFTATIQNDSQSKGVTWSLSGTGCSGSGCGTLSSTTANPVTYTSPPASVPGSTVKLTATSIADGTRTGTATIAVTQGGSTNIMVSITPKQGGLTTAQSLAFTATVTNDAQNQGVNWSASNVSCSGNACGTFSSASSASGSPVTYTAPSAAGVYTVTATSVSDVTKTATATIGITDLKGILSWRGMENDNSRAGVNSKEYALTTANVNSATFGKLFSCAVDGFVFAQPLYVSKVSIPSKGTHNVIYVATENDTLYAFDADVNPCVVLWQQSLLPGGDSRVTSAEVNNQDLGPVVGITGTPVIDLTTNTLYVVATSKNSSSTQYFQRLHAIDITAGTDKVPSVLISASVPGTGSGTNGTSISFDPKRNLQRPGLLLLNGNVYIAWGSHDDQATYHGWVIAYNGATLARIAAFSPTPDGSANGGLEGGIWMSGAAPSADPSGNVYLSIGNGTFDDTTDTVPPIAPKDDFSDSVLRLSLSGGSLALSDFFAPNTQNMLEVDDIDLGSTGVIVLPDLTGASPTHLMFCGGKDGNIYLMNRDNMGRYMNAGNAVVQFFPLSGDTFNGFRSTPAFFNNVLYGAGQGDPLMAVVFDPALRMFSPANPKSLSTNKYSGYGTTPVVSTTPASTSGIVWTIDVGPETHTPGQAANLRAYDASTAQSTLTLLFSGATSGTSAGFAVKFTVPMVANGKVYVGTQGEIDVFGLLP